MKICWLNWFVNLYLLIKVFYLFSGFGIKGFLVVVGVIVGFVGIVKYFY